MFFLSQHGCLLFKVFLCACTSPKHSIVALRSLQEAPVSGLHEEVFSRALAGAPRTVWGNLGPWKGCGSWISYTSTTAGTDCVESPAQNGTWLLMDANVFWTEFLDADDVSHVSISWRQRKRVEGGTTADVSACFSATCGNRCSLWFKGDHCICRLSPAALPPKEFKKQRLCRPGLTKALEVHEGKEPRHSDTREGSWLIRVLEKSTPTVVQHHTAFNVNCHRDRHPKFSVEWVL